MMWLNFKEYQLQKELGRILLTKQLNEDRLEYDRIKNEEIYNKIRKQI